MIYMENEKGIIQYINSRLLESKLEHTPWTYKFIENIFPSDLYENILNALPSSTFYKTRAALNETAKNENYNTERYVFPIKMENLEMLDSLQKDFWFNLIRILCSPEIEKTVLSVFKDEIEKRMKNMSDIEKEKIGTKNFKISKRAEIVKDFKKYHLGAHTDNYNKFMTFLFYLPKDNSISNLGTSIYECLEKIDINSVAKLRSIEETENKFKKIKTCKFIPNSLLIFPRTNYSFHGVDEVNVDSKERDLLLLNYYIKGD